MNETVAAAILGVVQGLTEFLPVSSSGHLVLFQQWLPLSGDQVAFDLALHIGTLLPVLVIYRQDLASIITDSLSGQGPWTSRPGVRMGLFILLGSIPTGIIGVLFQDWFEAGFGNLLGVGIAFALTGTVLFSTRFVAVGKTDVTGMRAWQAVLIGLAQGLAITPGISRSGSTIAVGMFLGLRRDLAARYSFLLSIPAISGAFLLKLPELQSSSTAVTPLLVGFLASAISGYVALTVLLRLVARGDFSRFAWYLWPLAAVAITLALLGS